ncbi:MAG: beta-lactamase family protein [Pseudomonadota bacterium]|nr:beta-lactamase family protein [Pseudomonadota bacterium]
MAAFLALIVAPATGSAVGRAASVPKASPPAQFSQVRRELERLVQEKGVPSITVAVARGGSIVWEEGFGWADRERGIPATPHTPYSLASVTKPITATAIMTLNETRRIDLDAPIETYLAPIRLTGLAAGTAGVTARRILAHSSGLPQHYWFYHAGYDPPSAEETLTRYAMVVFPPMSRFQYSNLGYRALDVAVERVTGQAYGDYLRTAVFAPLGMRRSAVGRHPSWVAEAAARYDRTQRPIPFYMTDTPGSGDVWASTHDLLRFAMFHLGTPLADQQQVLRPETIRAMQQPSSAPQSPVRWGLGWSVETERGHRVVRHGGNQPGVHNQLVLFPDAGVAIILLSNINHDHHDLWKQVAAAVLPERGPHPAPAEPPSAEPATPLSGRWVGTVTNYQRTEPFTLTFQPDGDVHVRTASRMASLVNNAENSGNSFSGWFYGFMNADDALRHRHNMSLTLHRAGDELVGQLVAETTPLEPGIFALPSFVRLRQEAH